MFKSPGHIAFSFYSIDIHYYGIIMSLSILIGLLVILYLRKKYFRDIKVDTIFDLSFILIIFGIISARLYYVIMDYKYFLNNPDNILAIWNGGISIQGAVIGGIIAGYIYTKKKNLNFFKLADLFSYGIIIGQAIGRWGNFFNSEAFGLPTSIPIKLYIPYCLRPIEYRSYEYFHPTFLYESILNLIIFIIMLIILKKKIQIKEGTIFCSYLILYSIVRLCIESIRIDSVLNIANIHIAHIMSILFIIFAIVLLIYIYRIQKN